MVFFNLLLRTCFISNSFVHFVLSLLIFFLLFLTDQNAEINTDLNFVFHSECIKTENKSSKTACAIIGLAFAPKLGEGRGIGGGADFFIV